jgi:gamma-glutamyl hydrolase
MTYNSHDYGIDPSKFETDEGLKSMFEVTALHHLPDTGAAFVASIESPKYPFFGTQFHPEMTS